MTSPLCDNIINIKKRFTNVVFSGIPTKTFKIYCSDTIENDKLNKEKDNPIISVIDKTDNNIIYDENLGNIVL